MLAEAATTAQTTRSEVLTALRQASAQTGSDFSYLLGTAMRESSLKPQAKSTSSSAAGLFQFVSQTWLGMVKQSGAKYGLGSYADAIHKDSHGRYRADNPSDRQAILALRNDPKISALMAGEYARQTKTQLESRLGRDVCGGELYAAHFLGPGAACRLIELNGSKPNADAAACFPAAAEANRSVFYHRDGAPKTVREVYTWALKQPNVSKTVLAQAEIPAAAPQPAAPANPLSLASALFTRPTGGRTEDLSTLGLFRGDTQQTFDMQQTASLFNANPLPQSPFVLTPGVVGLLAAMTPDGHDDKTGLRRAA
jgi:hypothetical protein